MPPQIPKSRRDRGTPTHVTDLFGELSASGQLRTVPIDAIAPNPSQPRKIIDPKQLAELAESITNAGGILQPPIVRETTVADRYELVAGERRWRAAKLLNHPTIDVLVRDLDHAQSLQAAILENVARVDLNPIERAHAFATMVEDLGLTKEEVGARLGISRESVSNHLRLLELPDEALTLVEDGRLTFAAARAVLMCDDNAQRRNLARKAAVEGWSSRQTEEAARTAGAPRAKAAPTPVTPERVEWATSASESLSAHTGLDLAVKASGTDTYTFVVHGDEAARDLAGRLLLSDGRSSHN